MAARAISLLGNTAQGGEWKAWTMMNRHWAEPAVTDVPTSRDAGWLKFELTKRKTLSKRCVNSVHSRLPM